MFNPPRTIQQASKRLYGAHPSESFKVECCAYEIIDPHFGGRQCFRHRGHGPAGLYCSQHGRHLLEIARANGPDIVPGSKEHLDWAERLLGI